MRDSYRPYKPLLKYPTQVRKVFPERDSPWPRNYPAVIKPWLGGVRAYWLIAEQAFLLENDQLIRVDGIEPFMSEDDERNLLGEFYEKGKTTAEILEMVLKNEPSENLDFNIFDAEMHETARERAAFCMNLPQQQDRHVRIATAVEVYTFGGFKTWFDVWKGSLFEGALAVGATDPWLATEWEVGSLV